MLTVAFIPYEAVQAQISFSQKTQAFVISRSCKLLSRPSDRIKGRSAGVNNPNRAV